MTSHTDLTPYEGRWVAIAHGRVLGVGYTGVEALRLARRNHPKLRLELTYVAKQSGARLALDPLIHKLKDVLARQDMPVYLVGGAVRDAVLGHISHDLDFVVPSNAIKLAFRIGDALGVPAYALDKTRDVGRVVLAEEGTYLDFSSYRNGSLEADLAARDFTINALAMPALGETEMSLIDLFDGLQDLKQKRVRHVSAENMRQDPIRGLRGIRMSLKYGFTLTAETEASVSETFALLSNVSAERVRDELNNLLRADGAGMVRELRRLDGLATVLPEVAALDGVTQSAPHHLDVGAHTEATLAWLAQVDTAVVQQQPTDHPLLQEAQTALAPYAPALQAHLARNVTGDLHGRVLWQWAALLHDIGKPATRTVTENGRIRFLGHEKEGAKLAAARLRRLRFSRESSEYVGRIVAGHMRPLMLAREVGGEEGGGNTAVSRRAIFRFFRRTGPAGLDICLLALADHLATYAPDDPQATPAGAALLTVVTLLIDAYFNRYTDTVAPEPLVTGRELMKALPMKGGPELGRLLRHIEEAQAAGDVSTPEEAIALARQVADSEK